MVLLLFIIILIIIIIIERVRLLKGGICDLLTDNDRVLVLIRMIELE